MNIRPKTQAEFDNDAVDSFAAAMKEKLAIARAKGRGGWEICTPAELSAMLHEHVDKGDPRDVANFCMFLAFSGSAISPKPPGPVVAWAGVDGGFLSPKSKARMQEDRKHGGEFAISANMAYEHDIPLTFLNPKDEERFKAKGKTPDPAPKAETQYVYLLEQFDGTQSMGNYIEFADHAPGATCITQNPHKAIKFKTKETAENYISETGLNDVHISMADTKVKWKAVQHGFNA